MAREQVSDYVIESYTPSAMDRVIGFLINPIVQGLLIMLIVGGIYFELQTPGIGFPAYSRFDRVFIVFCSALFGRFGPDIGKLSYLL